MTKQYSYKPGDKVTFVTNYRSARIGQEATIVHIDRDGAWYDLSHIDRGYAMYYRFVPSSLYGTKLYKALLDEVNNDET